MCWYLCIENIFDWQLDSYLIFYIFFFFLGGLVKLIFGLPKSEEYLPEGLPGILNICEPCCMCVYLYIHIINIHSTHTYIMLTKTFILDAIYRD